MYKIFYKPSFIKQYDKLEEGLKEEVREKIELLRNKENHQKLKAHKLHGDLSGRWSFSVTYKIRIVFVFNKGKELDLLAIGDHDVYK